MNPTKKSIIKKSIKLFNQYGFHITTKDIIENCKVSNGSFFYYFPKKETLSREILQFIIDDFNNELNKLIEKSKPEDFQNKIHFIFTHMLNWGIEKPEYFLFLIQIKNQITDLEDEMNVLHKTLFHYIADIEHKNEFKQVNHKLLTNIGISIIAHCVFHLSNKKEKTKEDINSLFEIFKNAIYK